MDLGLRKFLAILCGLSEETCSGFHQFRRSVCSWRVRMPCCRLCLPGLLFLLGCPLQSPHLPHPLGNTQEFLHLGNELLSYLPSNNPVGSGVPLPSSTFPASKTSISGPIYLSRGLLPSLKLVSGRR